MKEVVLKNILARTDGIVFYKEQLFQICLELLRLDRESSDHLINAYFKNDLTEKEEWNSYIRDFLGDEDFAKEVIFIFANNSRNTHYEFLLKMKEQNYNATIDNVLKHSDGLIQYYYQAVIILTDVFGISDYQVSAVIQNYKDKKQWVGEKEYLSTKMELLPSITERVHSLLCESANNLKSEVPILNF